jgi:hypothetical protein
MSRPTEAKQEVIEDLPQYATLLEDGILVSSDGRFLLGWPVAGLDQESLDKERMNRLCSSKQKPSEKQRV